MGKLLSKYGTRGWTSQGDLWPEDEASHKSMVEPRRLGDKWTWIIPFDQTGVGRPNTPDSVLEFSTFDLRKYNCSQPNPGYYSIQVQRFGSLVLKYHYVSSTAYENEFWTSFAAPRLERLSMIELWKIPPELRPAKAQYLMDLAQTTAYDRKSAYPIALYNLNLRDIELPCYDHEIPGWYAAWERMRSSRVQTADSD